MCTLDLQIHDFISRLLFLYSLNILYCLSHTRLDNLCLPLVPLITIIFDPSPPKKILLFFLMFFYILSIHSIPHHSLVTLILFVGVFNVVLISSVSSIFSISFIRTASLIFISCCYFIITLSSLVFLT